MKAFGKLTIFSFWWEILYNTYGAYRRPEHLHKVNSEINPSPWIFIHVLISSHDIYSWLPLLGASSLSGKVDLGREETTIGSFLAAARVFTWNKISE